MLTLDKFEEASEIVKKVTQETSLVYSEYFSQQTGNKVYLKPENMQVTGAYKIRGAYYKISTLSRKSGKGADYGFRRQPCPGGGLRGQGFRGEGGDRYAPPPLPSSRWSGPRATERRWSCTEMCTMKPARRPCPWRRRRAIPLSIPLTI